MISNKRELVSVIVPVYKVEQYLDRCVKSIITQSYTNIEIILVDDGSPDNCPQICDDWAKKDNRVKVIHKENGGLSDARNAGLVIATGTYICFVDSDDYVSDKFIETLYNLVHQYNTDMAAVGLKEVTTTEFIDKNITPEKNTVVFTGENALKELFSNNTFANYAWNKMYKKRLFKDIEFPINRKMEDLGTTYKLLIKANSIAFSSEQLYYYYQREDSILHKPNKDFYRDKFELSLERYTAIRAIHPDMLENSVFFLGVILEVYPIVYDCFNDYNWKEEAKQVFKACKGYLNLKNKIKYFMFKYCSLLYRLAKKQK